MKKTNYNIRLPEYVNVLFLVGSDNYIQYNIHVGNFDKTTRRVNLFVSWPSRLAAIVFAHVNVSDKSIRGTVMYDNVDASFTLIYQGSDNR